MSEQTREYTIDAMGAHGDGIARAADGTVFIPGALPGERVEAVASPPDRARLISILDPSPDRIQPVCPHFAVCGGCAVQHLAPAAYANWKRSLVVEALAHRGVSVDVSPLVTIPPASRRRAAMGVAKRSGTVILGFRAEGEHTLIPIDQCHVLLPSIVAAFPKLREIAAATLAEGASGRLVVTALDNGLDVSIETGKLAPDVATRTRLATLAEEARLVRLSLDGDPLITRERPRLTLSGVETIPPVGVFLQASRDAEEMMTSLVTTAVGKAKSVADLFCGVGTFTFPLARKAKVLALDTDRRSVETLRTSLRAAQGLKPVETRARDLFREPLSRTELAAFDAVVFDPPRAGAKAQAETLAKSKVPIVVAVSCSPPTLARDLRILIDGGYQLKSVTPIDQFVFTPHVETVAVLHRP